MPAAAAAMGTGRKPIRITMRRMIIHRTTMVTHGHTMTTVITMTTINHDEHCDHDHHHGHSMLMTASKATARPRRRAVARTRAIKQAAAQPIGDHDAMKGKRGSGAVPADDLALAGLSGGRVFLLQRHRMGGGSRRYRRCRILRDWLAAMLAQGPGFCDGVFLAHAHRAASSRDDPACGRIAELAAAFAPSRERHLETSAQGRAFIDIARAAWNCNGLDQMVSYCDGATSTRSRLVSSAPRMTIPLAPTMQAFLHALTSNWISAGARLIPLRQTDSQRVLALLEPTVVSHRQPGGGGIARPSRQRDFSRRSRQHAARDAVHEIVQVMRGAMHSTNNASPLRTQGPICRGLSLGHEGRGLLSPRAPVVMGPCVRRDDDNQGNI